MHMDQSRDCDRPITIDGSYVWKVGRPVDDKPRSICRLLYSTRPILVETRRYVRVTLFSGMLSRTISILNKAIVDSRLRPQSCCHLANCIEMQKIVDCKLDANNSTYANNPQEAIFVPAQKCPYHVTFDLDLDLDLEHTLDAGSPGDHPVPVWSRSDHLPARSDGQCKFTQIQYIVYIVDKLIAILRSRERAK